MVTAFLDAGGIMHHGSISEQQTVNSECYKELKY